jgi:hypothetical protein
MECGRRSSVMPVRASPHPPPNRYWIHELRNCAPSNPQSACYNGLNNVGLYNKWINTGGYVRANRAQRMREVDPKGKAICGRSGLQEGLSGGDPPKNLKRASEASTKKLCRLALEAGCRAS